MGIFKKTVKYSKASKDLNEKIKSLDEGLKKTGVIHEQNDTETFCVEEKIQENIPKIVDKIEVVKEEDQLYNWRETLSENNQEKSEEKLQEEHTLVKVENYISESNKELIVLRDQVFQFLEDDLPNTGLIAEEVNELGLPEFIRYDENGNPYSIPYDNLSALFINAIKELKVENDLLRARLDAAGL